MKRNARLANMIEKEAKRLKIHEREDKVVLDIAENNVMKTEEIVALFNEFIKNTSKAIAKNEIDYLDIIVSYGYINDELDKIVSEEEFMNDLEKHTEDIKKINTLYLDAVGNVLLGFGINDYRQFSTQVRILQEKFYTKAKNVVNVDIERSNKKINEVTRNAFALIKDLFKDFGDFEEEEIDIAEIETDLMRYEYIGDYRRLNSLAKENGYKFKSQKGDHAKYEDEEGNVVIIPQGRDVGYGLSIRIQKDIKKTLVGKGVR
ncbi:MAG: hypothetical protein J6J36_00445 [Clostridia bacterium]|nr:hypothetical protein [Clostridia bacterium]